MNQDASLSRKTIGAMAAVLACKPFSFLRSIVCAAIFGATALTDAFNVGFIIFSLVGGVSSSLTSVIVPIRMKRHETGGRRAADEYCSSLLTLVLVLSAALAAVLIAVAPQIVRVFAAEFPEDQLDHAIRITRLMLPVTVFLAAVHVFSGILNAHSRFLPVQLLGLPLSVGWMGVPLLMAGRWGIYALAAGYMIGIVLQAILVVAAAKGIFRYSFAADFRDPDIALTLRMCVPVFIGGYAFIVNQIIDQILASGLEEGSISALSYSAQILGSIQTIITLPVVATTFTAFSSLAQRDETEALKALLARACSAMVSLLAPVTAYTLLFAGPIVRIVYQRGAFDESANALTSQALFFYSLIWIPNALSLAFTRCHYAFRDTLTPLYVSLAGIAVNMALSLALVRFLHVGGLALATSVASTAECVLLGMGLRRKIGPIGLLGLVKNGMLAAASSVPLVVIALLVRDRFASLSPLSNLALAAALGLPAYFLALSALRHPDALALRRMIGYSIRSRIGRHGREEDGS